MLYIRDAIMPWCCTCYVTLTLYFNKILVIRAKTTGHEGLLRLPLVIAGRPRTRMFSARVGKWFQFPAISKWAGIYTGFAVAA